MGRGLSGTDKALMFCVSLLLGILAWSLQQNVEHFEARTNAIESRLSYDEQERHALDKRVVAVEARCAR